MTALTNCEVIATESPLAIVTRHATKSVRSSVMIERLRRSHLKSLCYASSNTMTIITTQAFVLVVLRMIEADLKSGRHLPRAGVTS
jgi:hypothetical protein